MRLGYLDMNIIANVVVARLVRLDNTNLCLDATSTNASSSHILSISRRGVQLKPSPLVEILRSPLSLKTKTRVPSGSSIREVSLMF